MTREKFSCANSPSAFSRRILTVAASKASRSHSQGGKVAGNGPTVTYIPRTNFWGFDSFYYSITNSANQVATIPMYIVVAFVNLPPSISSFLDQAVEEEDPPLVLSFAIGDVDTHPESLIVTAQSSNPTLLPASAITFQAPLGPANQARTVTLSPVAGEVGATTVTITVSDGDLSASSSFKYEVKSRLAFAPIDLGVLTGQPYSVASDINAAGQVVGYTATDDSESHPRGFFYTGFGPLATTIATATLGGDGSRLAHLNSKGKAVGASLTAGANINAFVASPAQSAVLTNLGSLVGGIESAATGINDEGLVVGYSQVGGGVYHPFVAGIQTMTDLGVPNAASQAFATAINNQRTIVGYSITGTGQTNAFVYDYYGATFTNLIQPPGADGSVATTINDAGEVAGYLFTNGQTHAAIALSGGWSDLGDMLGGGSARINDMNHFRQAVGTALNTNSQWQAFYYEDGHAYNLNQLLPSDSQDWNLVEARAINDQGQIVGVGQRNGQTRAFLLFPATEIGRRVFRPDGTLPTMPQVTLIQIPAESSPT